MSSITWLASYPRSGNTWMRLILWTLRHGRAVDLELLGDFGRMAINRQLLDTTLECDSGLLRAEEIEALRPAMHEAIAALKPHPLVKVHDAWRRTRDGRPVHDPAITQSTIYLIRDPRDVAVSWANFRDESLDCAIAYLANPNAVIGGGGQTILSLAPQHIGSWSTNAASWIDDSGLSPLVIRYEDMLADPQRWIGILVDYLGWPAPPEIIDLAVEATRFDRLRKLESETGFAERPASTASFFRAGRAEGWREVLSAAQAARIERDHAAMMARFGYR